MASPASRELEINYGAIQIGGTGSNYFPHGKFALDVSQRSASLEMDVIVQASTEAAFITQEAALVAAFDTEQSALTIDLSGNDRYNWDPSSGTNTALYTRPSARKPGSVYDTARSALYRIRVDVELPAGDDSGRRDVNISVSPSGSGKRRVEISGTWTAIGSDDAVAEFQANIAAYATTVLDGIDNGAQWALVRPDEYSYDFRDKLVQFSRIAEELIYDEVQGTTDHASLRNMSLVVVAHEIGGEDSDPSARRPVIVEASYRVDVVKSVTDLQGTWTSLCLPRIESAMVAALGGGSTLVYMDRSPSFDWTENVISATIRAESYDSSLLSHSLHVVDEYDPGDVYIPRADGVDHSYEKQTLFPQWRRTVFREVRRLGSLVAGKQNTNPVIAAGPERGSGGSGTSGFLVRDIAGVDLTGFKIQQEQVVRKNVFVGLPGSQQLHEITSEVVPCLRVVESGAGGSGGSGGGGSGGGGGGGTSRRDGGTSDGANQGINSIAGNP